MKNPSISRRFALTFSLGLPILFHMINVVQYHERRGIVSEPSNRSLARGLDILALLSGAPEGLALHQVARLLDLPKSSCSILLRTLLDKGFLQKEAASARYRLSPRLLELGSAAMATSPAQSLLRQVMEEIAGQSAETVHCGMRDGSDVLYIDKIESTHSIRMTSRIGLRMPLYATAMGRAILACLGREELDALLADISFAPLTPYTQTGRDRLLSILEQVRGLGYAVEYQENSLEVCCVGVAVRGRDGAPAYALSISMPVFRANKGVMRTHAQVLMRAKEKLEHLLAVGL